MSLSLEELAKDIEVLGGAQGGNNDEVMGLEEDQYRAKENYERKLKEIQAEGAKVGIFSGVPSGSTGVRQETGASVSEAVSAEQSAYEKGLEEITSTEATNLDLIKLAGLGSTEESSGGGSSPTAVEKRVDYLVQKLKKIDDKELEWNKRKHIGMMPSRNKQ